MLLITKFEILKMSSKGFNHSNFTSEIQIATSLDKSFYKCLENFKNKQVQFMSIILFLKNFYKSTNRPISK